MAGAEILDPAAELERLWADLFLADATDVTVVVEPRAPAPRQHPSPTHARPRQTGGGPGVTGVAKRSNIQARHTRAYEPTRRLTSVRNSKLGSQTSKA